MKYRSFGKLDWQVSALGFGCMRFPTVDGKSGSIDQDKVNQMIHRAIEAGINYFDTAYTYHEQTSEIAVGKALQGGLREKVRIATKSPVWKVDEIADFDRFLDEQLERLQTNRIDFYLLHGLNRARWAKIQQLDLLSRAEAAIADGRIRYLGFSFHDNLDTFKMIVDGYDRWDFCQIQYNYMDIDFQAGTAGLKYAASKGLAVVIMESLRGGKLALDLPATKPIRENAASQRTPADWALQWLWNQPEVSVALSGMGSLQQVEENIASANVSGVGTLSADETVVIEQMRQVISSLSPIACTHCEYCLPCPNGVNIPLNFEIYNDAAMYDNLAASRSDYKNWLDEKETAANCIQCEDCLLKCPQEIPISSWMPVLEEVLGLGRPFVGSI